MTAELTVARRAMNCDFFATFPAGVRDAVDAGCAALDDIERLESKLTVYDDSSDVSRWNAGLSDTFDAELYGLLRMSAAISADVNGAFDAASGQLVKAWGFYRPPKRVPSDAMRLRALDASGTAHLAFDDDRRAIHRTRPGIEWNLGSIGKGFAIDRAVQGMRQEYAVPAALLQGGQSSLRAIGAPSDDYRGWPVDIGDPPVARVWLRDQALGTSGAANQFFEHEGRRYGHVLDPRTGWPAAQGILSASAIAPSAAVADALSTAFFVLGVEGTKQFCEPRPNIGALLVLPGPQVLRFGKVRSI